MNESERLRALIANIQTLRAEVASFARGADALAASILETAPRITRLEHELLSFTQDVARFGLYAAEQRNQVAMARLAILHSATEPDREPTATARLPDIVAPCALDDPRR
jgi:hypothetical protein